MKNTSLSIDGVVEDLFASVLTTLGGPLYVALIGTVVARWMRGSLPWRKVFCGIAVVASLVLLTGYWYATKGVR